MKHALAVSAFVVALSAFAGPLVKAPDPICIPNQRICAHPDAVGNKTEIVEILGEGQAPNVLWSIPGLHESILLSPDGKVAAVRPAGNFVAIGREPRFQDKAIPVLALYREGKLKRTLTLGDCISRLEALKPADEARGRYEWGNALVFDVKGNLRVGTVEGKTITLDAQTGEILP